MHATIRATLLPEIIRLICAEYGWNEEEAMDRFYDSATGASFSDDETGLYGQSALYIFGLFKEEQIEVFESEEEATRFATDLAAELLK